MHRKWLGFVAVCAAVTFIPSCGSGQRLVSIAVTPSAVTFLTPITPLTFQLTALGTYTHPPATKDLTTQVTWKSNAANIATVTSMGVVATSGTGECGIIGITASVLTNDPNGNVVVGNATVTVDDTSVANCPQK
jgi:hypothetical protein